MEEKSPPAKRTPFFCQLDNERHPATADRYQCTVCGRLICSECYNAQNIVGLSSCPFCEGELSLLQSLGGRQSSSTSSPSRVLSGKHDLSITSWLSQGKSHEQKGNNMEALESYTHGLESYPQNAELWKNKAYVLGSMDLHKEAIICFDELLVLDPSDTDALNNKGVSLGSLKRYDEALECYDKAIQINSADVEAWFNRGAVLELLHHPLAALKCYRKVISFDPRDTEALKRIKSLETRF